MTTAFGIANTLVTWKRQTAELLVGSDVSASPGVIVLTRQPVQGCAINIKITGSPSGTVVISGTVDGSSTTETLDAWAGTSVFRESRKLFSAVSNIDASGLTGGTAMTVRARGSEGSPMHTAYTIKGPGHPVRIEDVARRTWPGQKEGSSAVGTHRFIVQFEEVWEPRKGDVVIEDLSGQEYLIVGRPARPGGLRSFEYVCTAVRREDSQGT